MPDEKWEPGFQPSERDAFKISYTESPLMETLPHTQRFKRDRWYFLFGIIPIWCITEEHNVYDPYAGKQLLVPDGSIDE